jgi:multidrug resistance efflux pump
MTWLRRFRPLLIVTGLLLAIGSLLGAKLLASGSTADPLPKTAAPTNGKNGSGPVVIGYVDTDPRPVQIGLPPVLQSGQVSKVFVKEGDEVKEKQELFAFDSSVYDGKQKSALAAVKLAETKVDQAKVAIDKRDQDIKAQDEAVAAAEFKVKSAYDTWLFYGVAERLRFKTQNTPEADWDRLLAADPKNFELQMAHLTRKRELEFEKFKLNALKAVDPTKSLLAEAEAGVELSKALWRESENAVNLCTVRAKLAGTIEQINVGPGDTIGISTLSPAMILVPAGPRIVRAEVEAEFAHRVTTDKIGKEVTIYDNSDSKITYRGKVVRIGSTFLPKRGGGGNGFGLTANETRVLEAVVEVIDPNPPGQPPLRVGQKVRVNFGH